MEEKKREKNSDRYSLSIISWKKVSRVSNVTHTTLFMSPPQSIYIAASLCPIFTVLYVLLLLAALSLLSNSALAHDSPCCDTLKRDVFRRPQQTHKIQEIVLRRALFWIS